MLLNLHVTFNRTIVELKYASLNVTKADATNF